MTAILIALGIAGAVLTAAIFFRGGLLAGCLMVLLTGSCFGHAFLRLSAGPLPITFDRLLLGLLVVQYVIFRRLGLTDPKPLNRADWALFGLMGVLLLSTFSHDWSIDGNQPVAEAVFFFLMPMTMYWVAKQSVITRRSLLWLLGGLAIFGVYLAITAMGEVRQTWWLVFPKYIESSANAEFFGRARGPFLNPIANGIVLCTCLCAALTWWPRLNRSGRLALMLTIGLLLVGIVCTLTRSVWVGCGAGLFVFLALSLPRNFRYAFVGATALLAGIVLLAGWDRFNAFKRDRDVSAHEMAESAQLRPILAVVAWNMFQDRPLLGCGFGQYERTSIHYLADRSSGLPLEKARPYVQHNTFLALLTEIGFIGAGLFALLLCLWGREAWQLWRTADAPPWARQAGLLFLAVLAIYLPNAMFHDVTLMPMATMLLFTLAGVTASLKARHVRHFADSRCFRPI